jgi:hypothetical protein
MSSESLVIFEKALDFLLKPLKMSFLKMSSKSLVIFIKASLFYQTPPMKMSLKCLKIVQMPHITGKAFISL